MEENRLVADISGEPLVEYRWRRVTKAEVKEIVRRYHNSVLAENGYAVPAEQRVL